MARLVLASASPRRAELLAAAGFSFDVEPTEIDESPQPGESPDAYVVRLAIAKARAAAERLRGGEPAGELVVLGADTTVLVDGVVLGKPADDREAAAMLRRLSGRVHDVLTGIALAHDGVVRTACERTRVRMARLAEEEIAWYVATGEPRDKAGAYAVQGRASRFIEAIEGSYTNVVGLPVATVYRLLREAGVSL
ncbi:MAG TPA: Maf family protein [Vicinamibacterales bacterium]|nr:Maf family protein [Vicinamibacterales bacterium]